jgi:hypothetical protein
VISFPSDRRASNSRRHVGLTGGDLRARGPGRHLHQLLVLTQIRQDNGQVVGRAQGVGVVVASGSWWCSNRPRLLPIYLMWSIATTIAKPPKNSHQNTTATRFQAMRDRGVPGWTRHR